MAKIPGLQLRGQTYVLRLRVPKDLLSVYDGKKEIIKTLKTRDFSEAKKRVHIEQVKIDNEFHEKRQKLKNINSNPNMLSSYDDYHLEALAISWFDECNKVHQEMENNDTSSYSDEEFFDALISLKMDKDLAKREVLGNSDDEVHHGLNIARKFLDKREITYDPTSKAFIKLGNMFSKAIYEQAQQSIRQWQGKPFAHIDAMFVNRSKPEQHSNLGTAGKITISDLFKEYLNSPDIYRRVGTIKNYTAVVRALEEMVGSDKYVHEITRADYRDLQAILLKYPSNAQKKAPKKSVQECCELAAINGWPIISVSTINSYMDKLKAIINYAEREGYIIKTYTHNLNIKDKVKKKDKRKPFDLEQLNLIFKAPLYTGCKDGNSGYAKVGVAHPKNARFWIHIIALWTGMRMNEICQLDLSDVAVDDGVDLILIQESDDTDIENEDIKRVKTEAGIRFVPIHPELKKMGFLDYVDGMRKKKKKKLFPELKKSKAGYSDTFSKWFGRFLKSASAKKPRTAFHSFRHSYRDALREAEVPRAAELQLGGWSSNSTDESYGSGLKASTLYKHICKIEYVGLDLSHLYIENDIK